MRSTLRQNDGEPIGRSPTLAALANARAPCGGRHTIGHLHGLDAGFGMLKPKVHGTGRRTEGEAVRGLV
jgi:hypothetical protein